MFLTGLLMIGSGLVIWRRRPHNRCWCLLVAAGFAWYIGDFEHARNRGIADGAFGIWEVVRVVPRLGAAGFPDRPAAPARPRHRHRARRRSCQFDRCRDCSCTCRRMSRATAHRTGSCRSATTAGGGWSRTRSAGGTRPRSMLVAVSMADRWRRSSVPGRRMLSPALVGTLILATAVVYDSTMGWNANVPRGRGAEHPLRRDVGCTVLWQWRWRSGSSDSTRPAPPWSIWSRSSATTAPPARLEDSARPRARRCRPQPPPLVRRGRRVRRRRWSRRRPVDGAAEPRRHSHRAARRAGRRHRSRRRAARGPWSRQRRDRPPSG